MKTSNHSLLTIENFFIGWNLLTYLGVAAQILLGKALLLAVALFFGSEMVLLALMLVVGILATMLHRPRSHQSARPALKGLI